jgi:hypothetical protein
MLWDLNRLKSKNIFAMLAIGGLVVFGLNKNISPEKVLSYQDTKIDTIKVHKRDLYGHDISAMQYDVNSEENFNEDSYSYEQFDNKLVKNSSNKIYETTTNRDYNVYHTSIDSENMYNNKKTFDRNVAYNKQETRSVATVIRKNSANKDYIRQIIVNSNTHDDINKIIQDENIVQNNELDTNTANREPTLMKNDIEEHAKMSASMINSSGFITGSPIPTVENNASNSTSALSHNNIIIFGNNRSEFPENSTESLHECYINLKGEMECRKSIVTCVEKDELGLDCSISYYENGIWYDDPTDLTISSKEEWIRRHLELKTTFAHPKFNRYFEERYSDIGLIRPDLNATKELKLKQVKGYEKESTILDIGLASLVEDSNLRVDRSIFTRGTRFGTGHEKIKGDKSNLLDELKEFLSLFIYIDDSDAYDVVDHWALMDDTHPMGDSEDFALTAMEWLLINGVDPKYITIVEMKSDSTNTPDIMLILEAQNPEEKLIVKEADILKVEELYPNGYEKQIENAYKYIEANLTS